MLVSKPNMIPYNLSQKGRKPALGLTLTQVRKTVTDPKNNVPEIIVWLDKDIFVRKKLEKPTQQELDALAKALKDNEVVGAAKATVRRVLERVKPVKP